MVTLRRSWGIAHQPHLRTIVRVYQKCVSVHHTTSFSTILMLDLLNAWPISYQSPLNHNDKAWTFWVTLGVTLRRLLRESNAERTPAQNGLNSLYLYQAEEDLAPLMRRWHGWQKPHFLDIQTTSLLCPLIPIERVWKPDKQKYLIFVVSSPVKR